MNEYAPFYIIAFMFVFSVFIVLKAYEHQLKLKRKQAALNHTQHIINISNVNNVVIRNNNGAHVITFHMPGQHVVPATVDVKTAERIFKELGELK